jgi:iduronate 2-sulfatase
MKQFLSKIYKSADVMLTTRCRSRLWRSTVAIMLVILFVSCKESKVLEKPNILFIAIDDLNNNLGVLGAGYMHTPNLDAFADGGRLFSRHYVQVPTCGPSRAALLRGKRPTHEDYLPNNAILNTHEQWGYRSLPAWFRNHGYATYALGKISHYPGGRTGEGWAEGPEELPGVWDRVWVPDGSPWKTPEGMMHGFANGMDRQRGQSPAWEAYNGPDTSYPDGWVANEAVEILMELSKNEKPWFFAVGFFKPHLPFAAPQKYFDLYDPNQIPAPVDTLTYDDPASSWHRSWELFNSYGQHPGHPQNDKDYAMQLRHAYAAATSYADAQVGKVLDALKLLGLEQNTIVVVWSDHGFALGHQGVWGKHSLYEAAAKSPLIIRYPGIKNPGKVSDAIVETVDIFPTLTDLAGLPTPEDMHGFSLRPQLEEYNTPSQKPAYSFFRRNSQSAVRVDDWRLIVHRDGDSILGYELFDFSDSPEGVRKNPDQHPEVVEGLLEHLESLPWIPRISQ